MKKILFVCSGNVFRSMCAEYFIKHHLGKQEHYIIDSAGITVKSKIIHEEVSGYMQTLGFDVSNHMPKRLTQTMLTDVSLIIAMNHDHQKTIKDQFNHQAVLFNKICHGHDEPILDLWERVPDWKINVNEARAYLHSVIDHIHSSVPKLIKNLDQFLINT